MDARAKNQKLNLRFSDSECRMEAVVFIAGMLLDLGKPYEPLRDFLNEDEEEIGRCFPDMPDHVKNSMHDGDDFYSSFAEWAIEAGRLGFLIQFATPVMRPLGASASVYSWGHYNTRWVYDDSFDGAIKKGLAWVKERRAAEWKAHTS